jgi:DNA-binding CsgD family transcriptional regulator/PAS domain-containing protein
MREQQVAALVEGIYDAALDASLWPAVIHDLVRLTRSNTGNIAELDLVSGATIPLAAVDMPRQGFADYEAYYWQHDIWTPKPGTFEIGRAYSSQHTIDDHVLLRSGFYHDWMKPLRLFYGMGGIPLTDGNRMLLIGVHRPRARQRPYGREDLGLLQRLFPHFKRALQIRNRLERATVERDALAETADHVTRAIFTFAGDGRILWANRAAENLCRQADGLTIRKGRLASLLPAEDQRLQQLVFRSLHTGNGAGLSCGGSLLVSRPSGKRSYVLLICPLRAGRGLLHDRQPAAVAFASDPERHPEIPLDRLMILYGLTQAEAQVAKRLAGGQDLKAIAAATHRTMNTIRTQLKQVFHKTRTSRQAQLVRLVIEIESGMIDAAIRR